MPTDIDLVGVSEAAEILSVSTDTIRRWEKKGLIKGTRSEHNYRTFDIDELRRMLQKVSGDGDTYTSKFAVLKSKSKTNYSSVELFAGCGGTALGFENAGIDHSVLIELDRSAAATLRMNRPDWNVYEGDVSSYDFCGQKAEIVQGGFPCQSFSYAGKKLGFEDIRGTLFFQFARAIREVQPKIAIGENVKGLLRHDNGRTLETMVEVLSELGYRVQYRVLRAQYLDVPQKRERLIILAIRKDVKVPFLFPKERNYTVSLREALSRCPVSSGQEYPEKKKKVMELISPGGYWRELSDDMQKEYMGSSYYQTGGKTGMARRLAWEEPSLTLTCSPAQKQTERCHPEHTRPLTVREYARVQTFPDDWHFKGTVTSQYKQIGNAVPVNLGYHIATSAIAMLNIDAGKPVDISEFEMFD